MPCCGPVPLSSLCSERPGGGADDADADDHTDGGADDTYADDVSNADCDDANGDGFANALSNSHTGTDNAHSHDLSDGGSNNGNDHRHGLTHGTAHNPDADGCDLDGYANADTDNIAHGDSDDRHPDGDAGLHAGLRGAVLYATTGSILGPGVG